MMREKSCPKRRTEGDRSIKNLKVILTASFSTTSNQSPNYVNSTFCISLQVMHVCILLPIHQSKAIIFSVLWLFRILPLLPLLRVIIPSCPQFQLYSLLLPEKAFTNARRKVDSSLPLLKSDW